MQSMVTITHNNRCAAMLGTVRRGPFAAPTQEQNIEFLLSRMKNNPIARSLSLIMPSSTLFHSSGGSIPSSRIP